MERVLRHLQTRASEFYSSRLIQQTQSWFLFSALFDLDLDFIGEADSFKLFSFCGSVDLRLEQSSGVVHSPEDDRRTTSLFQ